MGYNNPVGALVADPSPGDLPDRREMQGRRVRLEYPDAVRDSARLFEATHGDGADIWQWTYMGFGPFKDADTMCKVGKNRSARVSSPRDTTWEPSSG